jgi:hypothetical protein
MSYSIEELIKYRLNRANEAKVYKENQPPKA